MKRSKKIYLFYTISFLLLFLVIYSSFFILGKSFVYSKYGDGHICFNSFVYYGKYLRSILLSLLHGEGAKIPLWDMSVGYGADILTTFNWMTIGDPVNLLSALVSADNAEYMYGFAAVLRMFLTGVSFLYFARFEEKEDFYALLGALCYAFSGFALFAGIRDVYFISPMVYLPLLMVGVDKIFKGKKPFLFIIVVFLSAVTNFYYFYVVSIWVVIYAVFKYVSMFGKEGLNPKKLIPVFLKCCGYYINGILLAGCLLFPILNKLFGSERFSHHGVVDLFYDVDYYWSFIDRFITSESAPYWTHLGYAPICLLAVVLLFIHKDKKLLPLRIGFLLCTLLLWLPFFGAFMNAFSYVTNRWVFVYSLLVSYILVVMLPYMKELTVFEKRGLIISTILYICFGLCRGKFRSSQRYIMLALLLLTLVIILAERLIRQKHAGHSSASCKPDGMKADFKMVKGLRFDSFMFSIYACCLFGVAAIGFLRFSPLGSNYVNSFVDSGEAWPLVHNDLPSLMVADMEDSSLVRYDSLGNLEPMNNTAMNHGINGTDFYFSLADGTVTRYFDEQALNIEMEHRINGLDERTVLERLMGVKYVLAGEESEAYVPYGYEKKEGYEGEYLGKKYALYENADTLPILYSYDSYFDKSYYEELSYLDRQETMLSAAVIDTEELRDVKAGSDNDNSVINVLGESNVEDKTGKLDYSSVPVDFAIKDYSGCEFIAYSVLEDSDDSEMEASGDFDESDSVASLEEESQNGYFYLGESFISISEEDAYFELEINAPENSEVYLFWEGMKYSGEDKSFMDITYERNTSIKEQRIYDVAHAFYHGRDDFLINLGYVKEAESLKIRCSFKNTGDISLDGLSVFAYPMDGIDEKCEELTNDLVSCLSIDTNKISAFVNTEDDRILCLAVPFTSGWKAYVDGKERDCFMVNGVYVGILLEAGEHELLFKYTTPYLAVGMIGSILGILLIVMQGVYIKKKGM